MNKTNWISLDLGGGRTLSLTQEAKPDPDNACPSHGKLSSGTVECYIRGEWDDVVVLDGPGLLALLERECR